LLLVGVNKGEASREWQEVVHTLKFLVSSVEQKSLLTAADRTALQSHLGQGFELIQLSAEEQQEIFSQLSECLAQNVSEASLAEEGAVNKSGDSAASDSDAAQQEHSISPTGEEILDQEDLDDLAQLLGGCESEQPVEAAQQELSALLPRIDALAEESVVQVMIDGKFKNCSLHRNISNPSLYTICTDDGSFCLNRSRLGLAIALREGELQLQHSVLDFNSDSRTLIEPANRTRH